MPSDHVVRSWRGLGASSGIVTGLAQIIRSERDLADTPPEAILVARHATPALFPAWCGRGRPSARPEAA